MNIENLSQVRNYTAKLFEPIFLSISLERIKKIARILHEFGENDSFRVLKKLQAGLHDNLKLF
jgi:hypothetical protein